MEASCANHKEKHSEPPYAKKPLRRGDFGIGQFKGQTLIFIPIGIYRKLGKERIHEIASQAYGSLRLEVFKGSCYEYKNSYCLELPPGTEFYQKFIILLHEAMKASP